MLKQKIVEVKKVEIMSNRTEDKVGRKMFRPIDLFNHMTDEDFLFVHEAGQLKSLCMALSVDLQPKTDEEDKIYSC